VPTAPRRVRLQCGDIVIFRGERCEHWIEPVSAGRRVILQVELSRRNAQTGDRTESESVRDESAMARAILERASEREKASSTRP